jgi:hypothetical protein
VGALLLLRTAVGAVFIMRRRWRRVPTSDSGDIPRDMETAESTLYETLVRFTDTATVDALQPDPLVAVTSHDAVTLSLI